MNVFLLTPGSIYFAYRLEIRCKGFSKNSGRLKHLFLRAMRLPITISFFKHRQTDYCLSNPLPWQLFILKCRDLAMCIAILTNHHSLLIHLFLHSLHPFIYQVFIKGHQTVNDSFGCNFNDTVGDGLHKRMVMTGQ